LQVFGMDAIEERVIRAIEVTWPESQSLSYERDEIIRLRTISQSKAPMRPASSACLTRSGGMRRVSAACVRPVMPPVRTTTVQGLPIFSDPFCRTLHRSPCIRSTELLPSRLSRISEVISRPLTLATPAFRARLKPPRESDNRSMLYIGRLLSLVAPCCRNRAVRRDYICLQKRQAFRHSYVASTSYPAERHHSP